MVIYMDDYRKAQTANLAGRQQYDEEILCVNWNPAVRVLAESTFQPERELSPELPEDFSRADVDALLNRIYALATQV